MIQVLSGANAGRELPLTKSLTTLGKPGRQVAVITAAPRLLHHPRRGASFPLVNGRAIDARARNPCATTTSSRSRASRWSSSLLRA